MTDYEDIVIVALICISVLTAMLVVQYGNQQKALDDAVEAKVYGQYASQDAFDYWLLTSAGTSEEVEEYIQNKENN